MVTTHEGCPRPIGRTVAKYATRVADRASPPPVRTLPEVSVAPAVAADLVGYLRAKGFDGDAVCRRAGLDPADLATRTTRIPGATMAALWREAIAASGDPDLGMHATVEASPGALDIVGYVMLSSRTADEALRRGARLIRLLNDGLTLEITRERLGTRCVLTVLPTGDEFLQHDPRQVVETILIGIVHQLRMLTQRDLLPLSVTMRHARPRTGSAEHERLFKVKPRFGADADEVVIANADLDLPLRSANPALLASFDTLAAAALAALGTRDAVAGRAAAEIVAALKGEAPTVNVVARALAMSPRKLQRCLAEEGTSFQELLDSVRRELAVRHLADPNATVAKVAWLVGFSEPSAFHRAFRRWTGQSPRAVA